MKKLQRLAAVGMVVVMSLTPVSTYAAETVVQGNPVSAVRKVEYVYGYTDANGNVTSMFSKVDLTAANTVDPIKDATKLKNIKNIGGDEAFEQKKDGTIVWENKGAGISYTGTLEKKQDWELEISYSLDGKTMPAEEIAGKSGHVEIRYKLHNNTKRTEEIDGKKFDTKVPLAAMTTFILDPECFKSINYAQCKGICLSENFTGLNSEGKVDEDAGNYLILGLYVPDANEAFGINDYGLDGIISIPDAVVISAEVENFKMPATTTLVGARVLDEFAGRLEVIESALGDNEELQDMLSQYTKVAKDLPDGVERMKSVLAELATGTLAYHSQVKKGTASINSKADKFNSQLNDISGKKDSIKSEARSMLAYLNRTTNDLDSLVNKLPDPDSLNIDGAKVAASKIEEDANALKAILASAKEQLEEAQEFSEKAESYVAAAEEIKKEVNGIDIDGLVNDCVATAKAQATRKAQEVFAREGISSIVSESTLNGYINEIVGAINLESTVQPTKNRVGNIMEKVNSIGEIEVPNISIDMQKIEASIDDMEVQFAILQENANQVEGLPELLVEANSMIDGVKTDSVEINKNVNKLMDGLDSVDDTVTSAKKLMDQLNSAMNSMERGAKKISGATSEVSAGAKQFDNQIDDLISTTSPKVSKLKDASLKGMFRRIFAFGKAGEHFGAVSGQLDETDGGTVILYFTPGF